VIPGKPDEIWEGIIVRLPIKDDGEASILVLTWDVTEDARRELALKESEEKFRAMADNISQLAWMADTSGARTWFNERWLDYTGIKMEEAKGWGWLKAHYPENVDRVANKYKKAIKEGDFWEDTHPLIGKDGQDRWFLSRALPIKNECGQVVRWFGTNTDITDELETQRKLARSNAELQQFAYVASHDLQEPLRMVTAYLSLLEKKYGDSLDSHAKTYMDFAIDGGMRARELVRDLLELSHVESQAKPMSMTDMNSIMEIVTNNLTLQMKEDQATVVWDPMPEIMVDETQLTLLLQNLVSNGIKFHGAKEPIVHVSCKDEGDKWQFAVKDNGIGIDPQFKDKIFVIFQRLHSQDEYKGTGIGLAIAKKIVDRHGGRIWFDSEIGKGTTFYFTIPKRTKA
jgi:PAS domain S-box-containing protein